MEVGHSKISYHVLHDIKKEKALQKVKEHYVPQFYLNQFTDSNGLLHIYNFDQKKFYTQIPRNVCFEKNLYETEWEDANSKLGKYVLPNDIENEFCKYEREFAKLLQIISSVCTSDQNLNALILHGKEKEILRRFTVNLMLRNPINMDSLALSEIPEEEKNSDGMSLFRNILNAMGLGGADSVYLAAQKKAMLTYEIEGSLPQVYVEKLSKISFMFLYATNSEFVTSDIPACFGYDCTIPDEDKTCLYLALSPKVAVLFGNYNIPRKDENRMIKIGSEYVDFFNSQIIEHHNHIRLLIGNSRETIEKYI